MYQLFDMRPPMRLALFLGLTGIGMIAGALISFSIVSLLLHIPLADMQKVIMQPEYASMAQLANALASIIAFGLPSIALSMMAKGNWYTHLGFTAIKSYQQIAIIIFLALTGLILSGALGNLTEKIPIPTNFKNWAEGLEAQYKKAMLSMTQMHSIVDLGYALLAVAIIPSIIEEIYFRGTLQKVLMDLTGKPYAAIILTAIFFSAIHFSYFGFLSRAALGIVLGYIYYYSKNIWLPIFLHFLNNGIAVVTLYSIRNNPAKVDKLMDDNLPIYWGILALAVVYYLLKKLKNDYSDAGLEKSI
ncbi:MAG: CPBP family intramembrane metalloprotease [Chitinophagia bacterium]|nr:CPBP family intramembrane metalloprotease [Chitinophagia bacterium]NCA29287.1 CPBP family intramembrane metalloprotease [Chitinophagia bacterium]